jgi:ceramide glucosyltransferase
MILFTLTFLSTLLGLAATVKLLRWPQPRFRPQKRRVKISILKPIRGLEPDLEINLHSFFNLSDRVPFELLLCVKNPEDPAVKVVRRLMEMHPLVEAKLYTGTPDLGRNPKVSNMHYAWNRASSDLILISDSNVRVEPNYLQMLLDEREAGAGLVTQAVYGVDAKCAGGHLDVAALNSFYLKATAFLQMVGHSNVLGKCMLFSRSQFEGLGGIFSVRNYLAEDLVAGEMLKSAGEEIRLAPELLRQTTVISSLDAYWNRHMRWARLRKCHVPHAYALEPLMFETIWPVLLIALVPEFMEFGFICLVIQFITNLALHTFKFQDQGAWKSFLWAPVKDVLVPMIWLGGLVSNKVVWRGQTLYLRFGGKLRSRRSFELLKRRVVA